MNIGFVIGRIGGVDGVALETEKWIEVLKRLGHTSYLLSGQYEKNILPPERQTLFTPLSFFSPECRWEQEKAFLEPDKSLGPLLQGIQKHAEAAANAIMRWVRKCKLDVLVSQNASALPLHLSMALGIHQAVEKTGIPTITHDHDFAWERGDRYLSPHPEVNELVTSLFPLRLANSRHVVINSAAGRALKDKFGRESYFVPNVMDFNEPYGLKTDYNSSLLQDLGLNNSDIVLLQVTRVVRRKGIETAIELIERLHDKRFKLVVTGSHTDDEGGHYFSFLMDRIHEKDLSDQIIFASDSIRNDEHLAPSGDKVYTLSDAYAHGRACTYFSSYEGFGNAFVEALIAKKPIFVNNYQPVYWEDIGSKGFETVMIENNELTDDAVRAIHDIATNEQRCREIAEHNFKLGKELFSYEVLEQKLTELLSTI